MVVHWLCFLRFARDRGLGVLLRARGVALLDCMIERAIDMGFVYGRNDLAFMATEFTFAAVWVTGVSLLSSMACIPNSSWCCFLLPFVLVFSVLPVRMPAKYGRV